MTRVIQDSDDEYDEESIEPVDNAAWATGASSATKDAAITGQEAGSGSTGSLKNAFGTAHHAAQLQPQFTDSLLSKSLSSSPFVAQMQGQQDIARDVATVKSILELEGTIRQNYALHEPMAMFPELSSTIPNNTLTQQRLFDEVTAPGFLGIDLQPDLSPALPPYELRKSSIPWSDFLKSTSERESMPDQGSEQLPPEQHGTGSQGAVIQPEAQLTRNSQRSQQARPSSSGHRHSVSVKASARPELLIPQPGSSNAIDMDTPTIHHMNPPKLDHDPSSTKRSQSAEDTKSQVESDACMEHPKKKKRSSPALAFSDELEAMGLPAEQYKPRPSRSRSLRVPLEPEDYSVRPEKTAKRKTRRTKTTGSVDESTRLSTPEKVRQICEMGFSPTTTQKTLGKNDGDVRRTVEWLVTNASIDDRDELAPTVSPKAKGKTRKNAKSEDSSKHIAASNGNQDSQRGGSRVTLETLAEGINKPSIGTGRGTKDTGFRTDTTQVSELRSPAKVQVVIPRPAEAATGVEPKQHGTDQGTAQILCHDVDPSNCKAKRKRTVDDSSLSNMSTHQNNAPEPAKEKKRGRGRPKKDTTTTVPEVQMEEPTGNTLEEEAQQSEPTQPIGVEEQPKPPLGPGTPTSGDIPTVKPSEVLEQPTKISERQASPAHNAREPLSKGKVPYRVGLSKRARIAPLLRVMKK